MKRSIRRILLIGSVLLLPIFLVLQFFVFQKSQEQLYVETIEKRIHAVEESWEKDLFLFQKERNTQDSMSFEVVSSVPASAPFFIIQEDGSLRYWSDPSFSLDFSALDFKKTYQLVSAPYGTFLVKSTPLLPRDSTTFFIQAYRLVWPGTIKNDYLAMGPNPELFGNELFTLYSSPEAGNYIVTSVGGTPLFGIDFQLGFVSVTQRIQTPLFIFICSLFLLYALGSFQFLRKKWNKGQGWQALGYGFLILLLVRVGMLLLHFPRSFLHTPLFDPLPYSSSWMVPSLGDLLLHTLCLSFLFGLLIFLLSSKVTLEKIAAWREPIRAEGFLVLLYGATTLVFMGIWWIPRNFILHSQWSLDLSALPSFEGWTVVIFLILFLWAAVYALLSLSLLQLLSRGEINKVVSYKVLFFFAFLVCGGFFVLDFWLGVAGLVHFLFLFSILKFDLFTNVFRLGLETFLTLFYASLVGAAVVAASTFQSTGERLVQSKIDFAEQQLLATDERTAVYLEDIFTRLKNDLFVQNRMGDPLLSKDPILSKIRKIYLDDYFDQFEVVLRIFSPSGNLVAGSSEGSTLRSLQQQYVKSDFATQVKDVYFIQDLKLGKGNKFVAFVPIVKGGQSLGSIYLELTQLRIQSGSAYPRLLLDSKYADKLTASTFDYGIFREGELLRSGGSFNYQQEGANDVLLANKGQSVEFEGYQHVAVPNGEQVVVISSPSVGIRYFYTILSLFFVVFVSLTFLSILLGVSLQGYRSFEFNYSTKLQLVLNFAFFFPLIIISLITTGLLSQSYRDDLNAQYLQKAQLIKGNLVRFFGRQAWEEIDREALTEEINTLATNVGSDIHLYSGDGLLLSSSRSDIFDKKLRSSFLHPGALTALVEKQGAQVLLEEEIGKLRYQTVYLAIPSQIDGSLTAIVAIPFFESEEELNTLITDVLGKMFTALVVIFIVFLMVSFLVTKNLTLPFRLLTQKLKATNLENMEPMVWSSKDEIGLLVNEYNLMLSKLEASKKILASTEKESAWREMAKQVAHEIKNPLTPMKLTLQHLLRLEQDGKLEEVDKLKKSLETLIHQVDALSGIASSFATFAKMPLPNNERMNFKEVLVKVIDLFKTDARIELDFQDDSFREQIPILGDDKLFGRVVSNLIINGVQAVESEKKARIRVWLWVNEQAVFLEISDNGKGIPLSLRDKIFIPNFSTKSQGSGLGLAIAKSGVETAGGKIWFETEVGKGTTFFLTFPLVKEEIPLS